jgi:putative ABC transport system permease protein
VVLGDNANNRIFGGGNSVGKSIELNGKHYKVVGVLKPWHLRPRFYHITENQAFFTTDDIFVPLETALDENLPIHGRSSSTDSWYKASDTRDRNVYYLHAWVELSDAQQKMAFQNYLDGYTQSLKEAGEHPNKVLNVLHDVNEWIEDRNIVDKRILAFAIVSILFLIVCVFNASSLLLARLHAAVFEHGLRRAIGASKWQLMLQGIIESTLLGLFTGLIGLLLANLFLTMSVSFIPSVRNIAVLDPTVMLGGVVVAVIVTNLSNLYPLIRVNHRTISTELK